MTNQNDVNNELIRLFLESSGLVIKLYQKLQYLQVSDKDLYMQAAKTFISRNDLYHQIYNTEDKTK